jgi:hypothetical protein
MNLIYIKHLYQYLFENYQPFKVLPEVKRAYIVHLTCSILFNKNRIHKTDDSAFSISSTELQNEYYSNNYVSRLSPFFTIKNNHYNKTKKISKSYQFNPDYFQILMSYKPSTDKIDIYSDYKKKLKKVPKYAIKSKDIKGKVRTTKTKLNPIVPINIDALNKLIEFCNKTIIRKDADVYNKILQPKKQRSLESIERLYISLKLLNSSINNKLRIHIWKTCWQFNF